MDSGSDAVVGANEGLTMAPTIADLSAHIAAPARVQTGPCLTLEDKYNLQ